MSRFFMEPAKTQGEFIDLADENAKHLMVLRYKIGDEVVVCDGEGFDYHCEIRDIGKKDVRLWVKTKQAVDTEPQIKITLFQGLPKADKMELIIQKCVELGVHRIVPIETENIVVKIKDKHSKTSRWEKISESAAKQSMRGIIPQVTTPVSFKEAIAMVKDMDEGFIAYEKEENVLPRDCFGRSKGREIGIFIGPEGGFTTQEIEQCIEGGIKPFSLGKRILRTETAGFSAIILLLFLRESL